MLKCSNGDAVTRFKIEALNCLRTSISYLEKWFNFDENCFKDFRSLKLNSTAAPTLEKFNNIVSKYKIPDVDIDAMFEECIKLKRFWAVSIDAYQEKDCSEEIWLKFFQQFPESKNILRVISFIYSIPHANASSERIFSLMGNSWRKERNRMHLETVEAELIIKQNFRMSCTEFKKYLNTEEGILLLKKVKLSDKYL